MTFNKIPVFYAPKMNSAAHASPSAAKPAKTVAAWKLTNMPIEIIEPSPVTVDDFAKVHDRTHVEYILACHKANGFGSTSAYVAESLPYTTGSMLAAARHALATGEVAVSPTSGFHHAKHASAGGFCTFNGLMVTAKILLDEGLVHKVGIIDCDNHYGNGTDEIIAHYGLENSVMHYTAGRNWPAWRGEDALIEECSASDFLNELTEAADSMADCDIVLYQAGGDQLLGDPLGGWLTKEELQLRDRIVFNSLWEHRVPVAWNLAGGYTEDEYGNIPDVLEVHINTMVECVSTWLTEEADAQTETPAVCNDADSTQLATS